MASINLDSFHVTSLHIDSAEVSPSNQTGDQGMQFSWDTATHQSDLCKYRLAFGIETQSAVSENGKDGLPAVRLTLVGYFAIGPDVPEDQHEKILLVNGSTILYGIARGLLAGVSGAFGNSILLPAVDMVSIVNSMMENRKLVTSTSKPKSRKTVKPKTSHAPARKKKT